MKRFPGPKDLSKQQQTKKKANVILVNIIDGRGRRYVGLFRNDIINTKSVFSF